MKLNLDKYINDLSHIGKEIDKDFRITNINTNPPLKPSVMDMEEYMRNIIKYKDVQIECYKYLLKRTYEEVGKIIK